MEPIHRITYSELVDIPKLQTLMDSFYQVIGVANAVIEVDGTILASAGWQRACTGFHRVNADTCRRCLQSDTSLVESMTLGKSYAVYRCHNGLVDAAAPIMVEGAHDVPRLRIFNKIDHVGDAAAQDERAAALRAQYPGCIVMSARRPDDVAGLRAAIVASFQQHLIETELFLAWSAQQQRGEIYANCEVLEERADGEGAFFRVRGERGVVQGLHAQFGLS